MTRARITPAPQALIERDLAAWADEFLRAPDEPPPPSLLPLVFSLPPPTLPPAPSAPLDRDLTSWADEFLDVPDEPPPPSLLPLVFSLPPPAAPPRRAPSLMPVAA